MHAEELKNEPISMNGAGTRWAMIAAAIGVLGLLASFFLAPGGEHGREAFLRSYLVNFMFFLSLGLGGLFFVMITHLVRAGWSVPLRRVAEALAWMVIPMSLGALVVMFNVPSIYEWSHADVVEHDWLLQQKAGWLNESFFMFRIAAYFAVWSVLALIFVGGSAKQDKTGDPAITRRMEVLSAPGMILFAVTVTLAAFDLIMSLYPHWYSTIFGVYYFSGAALGFFCLVPLIAGLLHRSGRLGHAVTVEHYHDFGRLMFAFVCFWAYIAFSQYMLIWYGNIPEETIFYKIRQTGPWLSLSLVLLFGHFILPFLFLMSRHPKRHRAVLSLSAVWLLLMHWCDMFYLIVPGSRIGSEPWIATDLSLLFGMGGLFFALVFWRLGRGPLIPVKDPRLTESLGMEHA